MQLVNRVVALRIAVVLWVVGGAVAALLAISVSADWVKGLDDTVGSAVVEVDALVALGRAFNLVGSLRIMAPVMIIVAVYLTWKRRWMALSFWVSVSAISQLVVFGMKALYARPRPPIALVHTTGYSFPSGHALTAAALALALVMVISPRWSRRRGPWIVASTYAVAMAWSRVYVQAHWLSDVVAGAAIGAAVALSTAVVVQAIWVRRVQRDDGVDVWVG